MAASPRVGGAARPRQLGDAVESLLRRAGGRSEAVLATGLCALSLLIAVAARVLGATAVPPASQVLPLLLGGLLLRRRSMRVLLLVVAAALLLDVVALGIEVVRPGAIVLVVLTAALTYEFTRSRDRLGLSGLRGDSMLVELGERLGRQGTPPPLPGGWYVETVLAPAGGGAFAGDFIISALTGGGSRLEIALVDVSGKGVDAGTRALLLSGAMGGLLGAVPPEEFLPAADAYLLRQSWDEGFASAVHVTVDLDSGDYVVDSAGHPPAAQFDAGSGRWRLSTASGLLLGLLADAERQPERGRLRPGDALMLYTDGLVEIPGRDLAVGIDKLVGEAERLVPRGFAGGVHALVDAVAPAPNDDRALVLLWRG